MVRVRFAPSPTGFLHIGGARTALFNYLFAKKEGGKFILRVDDTDKERSTKEFEEDILEALRWLGMDWDEGPFIGGDYGPYRQSERLERHKAVAQRLIDEDKAYLDPEGVIRLRYPANQVVVKDLVCGDCAFSTDALGTEPVIVRSDGTPTYHLASVADDVDYKITHIIRGQDHLTNSAKHQVIFEALGAEPPKFAHLPLILGEDGSKLSKRNSDGMVSVNDFRKAGFVAESLSNFLMLLGWSHPKEKEQLSVEEVCEIFSLDRVGQTGSVFETNKLEFLNGWWIRKLDASRIAEESIPFLGEYQEAVEQRGKDFWPSVVEGLQSAFSSLTDAKRLAELIFSLEPEVTKEALETFSEPEAKEVLTLVLAKLRVVLPELALEDGRDAFSGEQFGKVLSILKKELDVPKKLLFQSVRIVVTGEVSGPDLKTLVPFIQRETLLSRLDSTAAAFSLEA